MSTTLTDFPPELIEKIGQYVGPAACLMNFINKDCQFPDCDPAALAMSSIKHDNPELLKIAIEKGYQPPDDLINTIIEHNALKCLQYIPHDPKPIWGIEHFVCQRAAHYGHFACLKFLHENGYSWDESTCSQAAYFGHFDCLRYARENGCKWDRNTFLNAVKGGHLGCLEYITNNSNQRPNKACHEAAYHGHYDCLVFLHKKNFPMSDELYYVAKENGHHRCAEYIRTNTKNKEKVSSPKTTGNISDAMADFLDVPRGTTMKKTRCVKLVLKYIKDNDLQDPADLRCINLDDRLKKLFNYESDANESIMYFLLQRLLQPHFIQ